MSILNSKPRSSRIRHRASAFAAETRLFLVAVLVKGVEHRRVVGHKVEPGKWEPRKNSVDTSECEFNCLQIQGAEAQRRSQRYHAQGRTFEPVASPVRVFMCRAKRRRKANKSKVLSC